MKDTGLGGTAGAADAVTLGGMSVKDAGGAQAHRILEPLPLHGGNSGIGTEKVGGEILRQPPVLVPGDPHVFVGQVERMGEQVHLARGRFEDGAAGQLDFITVGVVFHLPEEKASNAMADEHEEHQQEPRKAHGDPRAIGH